MLKFLVIGGDSDDRRAYSARLRFRWLRQADFAGAPAADVALRLQAAVGNERVDSASYYLRRRIDRFSAGGVGRARDQHRDFAPLGSAAR